MRALKRSSMDHGTQRWQWRAFFSAMESLQRTVVELRAIGDLALPQQPRRAHQTLLLGSPQSTSGKRICASNVGGGVVLRENPRSLLTLSGAIMGGAVVCRCRRHQGPKKHRGVWSR